MIGSETTTAQAAAHTRSWRAMPTVLACAVACLALVVTVGLQTPASTVGLRWTPGPRSRTLELIPVEPFEAIVLFGDRQSDDRWRTWLAYALAVLIVAAILFGVLRWLRHNSRRAPVTHIARTGADSRAPTEAEARILHAGLVAAIDVLTAERDPGNAVVKAWQGLQDAAASAGVNRRPAETASEFTARILHRSRGSAAPISVLLSLYQRVRFGEHSPSAQEIADAQNALAVLVSIWRADFPVRRQSSAPR